MTIRLCISSQTPPIQPLPHARPASAGPWRHGIDYTFPTGGLVPMMRALLTAGRRSRWIAADPRWVALGSPSLPRHVTLDEGFRVETIDLDRRFRAGYTRFKEAIWRSFHGPRGFRPPVRDYAAFVRYSSASALALLPYVRDVDLYYVNDFQQVLVGGLIGSAAPALLRWHIPLDFRGYPEPVRRFFLKAMEGFDGIVVSTRAALEDLIEAGFQGRAFQVYPYFDPATIRPARAAAIADLRARFGLGEGPILTTVGRFDPVKRQDIAIRALARIRRNYPSAQLLVVGGGSFTTAGLGSRKAQLWRAKLDAEVRRLRLGRQVVFTDTVSDEILQAAYSATDVFLHPAPYEGFGLVVLEAWMHGRPVVVSRGAGCSELVESGFNGYVTAPGSVDQLAARAEDLLRHPETATRMGEAGRHSAQRCAIGRVLPRLHEIFERTIEKAGSHPRGVTH